MSYEESFMRNQGLLNQDEQRRIRDSCVGIAGAGGVGGAYAVTLARMGVGRFKLADFDKFELANLNRQQGAFHSTLGQAKVDVLKRMILDINPEAQVELYVTGVTEDNTKRFLTGCDAALDALDFYALDARRRLFRDACDLGVPAVTSGPAGFTTTLHIFTADSMSFEEYFDFASCRTPQDLTAAFMAGIAPGYLHRGQLMHGSLNFEQRSAPSIATAIQLCAAVACTQILMLLTGRKGVLKAPRYLQFDPMRGKLAKGTLRWGNRGPMQRIKRHICKRLLQAPKSRAKANFNSDEYYLGNYYRRSMLIHALLITCLFAVGDPLRGMHPAWLLALIPFFMPRFRLMIIAAVLAVAAMVTQHWSTIPLLTLAATLAMMYLGCLSAVYLHNAAHGNFRPKWLNPVIGEFCALQQLSGFAVFKFVHHIHHANADDSELDPHPPKGFRFIQFLDATRTLIGRSLRTLYLRRWGNGRESLERWKRQSRLAFATRIARALFVFLLLGPQNFLLLFLPSYVANILFFACFNYFAHREQTDGSTRILNLNETPLLQAANALLCGVFYHRNHHLRPRFFNPKRMVSIHVLPASEPAASHSAAVVGTNESATAVGLA
jgi:tRNA threonylcarbamoyladenosine dehydratase